MCGSNGAHTHKLQKHRSKAGTAIPFCKFDTSLLGTDLSSEDRVSIPLLAQLIPRGVKPGTVFTVEFDPDSQWLAVATTIAAKYLQAGGRVGYVTGTRPPEAVRENLANLGVDVPAANKEGRLLIDDWYTATLTGGRIETEPGKTSMFEPIEGGLRFRSLKVADLSVEWLKQSKYGPQPDDVVESWPAGALAPGDSFSELLRFNDENVFLEWWVGRVEPNERRAKRIHISGFARGVHSDSFYKRLESSSDGVIDVRVIERDDEAKNLLRVRSLKGQPHDARWHEVEIKPNGEAVLTT